jgi:hypothetical protein
MIRRYRSQAPLAVFGLMVWLAFTLGHTIGKALVIVMIASWALAAIMMVYMVLFRNMKLSLFRDDPEPESFRDVEFVEEEPQGRVVEGDTTRVS